MGNSVHLVCSVLTILLKLFYAWLLHCRGFLVGVVLASWNPEPTEYYWTIYAGNAANWTYDHILVKHSGSLQTYFFWWRGRSLLTCFKEIVPSHFWILPWLKICRYFSAKMDSKPQIAVRANTKLLSWTITFASKIKLGHSLNRITPTGQKVLHGITTVQRHPFIRLNSTSSSVSCRLTRLSHWQITGSSNEN